MNWESMRKNVGCRVQLEPVAHRLDAEGRELESVDDDWIIQNVGADKVEISNVRTGHHTALGKDHIHHFTSNPDRCTDGLRYGFLTLNVQISIQGTALRIRPTLRPGESPSANRSRPIPMDELASLVERARQALGHLVTARASDESRAEVARIENEICNWLALHLGKLHAEAFRSAPPSMLVPADYPAKFGGVYQGMRGKLGYLSSLAAQLMK